MIAGEEEHRNDSNRGKPLPRRNSSLSDAESILSHPDSWHSPLPLESPHQYHPDPQFLHENNDDSDDKFSKALVLVDHNHLYSPTKLASPSPPLADSGAPPPVVIEVSKLVKEERSISRSETSAKILKRTRTNTAVDRVALALRAFGAVASLVSFSVLAADRTQGWSGDSFDRYIEYRYCFVVNIIGFVYSAFQAVDATHCLVTGKPLVSHCLRRHLDFAADQILAYLLVSASTSAATRVEDWISNWGEDEFTMMAGASIAVSFLAFAAFSITALISGYRLCNTHS